MLPSFYVSSDKARGWSVARAAGCGAAIGVLAGLFKAFGPLHQPVAGALEIIAATIGFAALCAAAAALRNVIARRLIWPDL
jgi:hypothetical protein